MRELPAFDAHPAQIALRRHLEQTLGEWGVPYRHEDVFAEKMGGFVCGWGTNIDVPSRGVSIQVWFDALDNDIAIYGARPYSEWLELDDLAVVLSEVTATLRRMLDKADAPGRIWRRFSR